MYYYQMGDYLAKYSREAFAKRQEVAVSAAKEAISDGRAAFLA
jgi:hypothetical protein